MRLGSIRLYISLMFIKRRLTRSNNISLMVVVPKISNVMADNLGLTNTMVTIYTSYSVLELGLIIMPYQQLLFVTPFSKIITSFIKHMHCVGGIILVYNCYNTVTGGM